jgi:hypothetical protein
VGASPVPAHGFAKHISHAVKYETPFQIRRRIDRIDNIVDSHGTSEVSGLIE